MTIPAEIDTPEILVDVDALDRNIARMAQAVQARAWPCAPTRRPTRSPRLPPVSWPLVLPA